MENSNSNSRSLSLSLHPTFQNRSPPADESPFELYTIPVHANWFSWDNIHEIEKLSLKEFFDGSSISRSPRIYKEYRDFIISKYREDPSRKLTFSEVRKSLVGDVNYLRRVFSFLERWGLINFRAAAVVYGGDLELIKEEERWNIKLEEGPPLGVKVTALPNSLKPLSLPPPAVSSNGCSVAGSSFKMPPLASSTDIYAAKIQLQPKELVCRNCKEPCDDSGHYEDVKEGSFIICAKCFKNGDYGNRKAADDFKFVDHIPNIGNQGPLWTEAETLLLLESVLKHGDDWELIAKNFETKSKQDCISKLIQLPFGELMLGSAYDMCRYWDTSSSQNAVKQGQEVIRISQETTATEHRLDEHGHEGRQNGDADTQGPPTKRVCTSPISDTNNSEMEQIEEKDKQMSVAALVPQEKLDVDNDSQQIREVESDSVSPKKVCSAPTLDVSSSLMKQVARISATVGPLITASAAEGAVTALCHEHQCPREIFCEDDTDVLGFSTQPNETVRTSHRGDPEMDDRSTQSEQSAIPFPLRVRAATATALGAAAAHAKLLAIQEDMEVEHLVATIIDNQMKKLQCKLKLLNDLELIMEKEFSQMEDLEESLLSERMDVRQRIFDAGISKFRDHTSVRSQTETVL